MVARCAMVRLSTTSDEDKANNAPSNLRLHTRASHISAEHSTRGAANANWRGGRANIVCRACGTSFLPRDRRNDYGAKYCSRRCFHRRNAV